MTPVPLYLLGPTGSGKHEVAVHAAEALGSEIISADSVKVYRGMDIGSAKPSTEALARVPHHLIDVADPWEVYHAGRFVEEAEAAERSVVGRGKAPMIVGGTPLYVKAFRYGLRRGAARDDAVRRELEARAAREGVEALHAELAKVDAAAARKIHPRDAKRVVRALEVWRTTGRPWSEGLDQFHGPARRPGRVVVLRRSDEDLRRRIETRLRRMVDEGFLEEVRRLVSNARGWSREPARSHGYAEMAAHLKGEMTLDAALDLAARRTWRYTRHQRQWFRRFEEAVWLDVGAEERPESVAARAREVYTSST